MDTLFKLIEATKSLTLAHLLLMAIGGMMTIALIVVYENRGEVYATAVQSKASAVVISGIITVLVVAWVMVALVKHIDDQNDALRKSMQSQIAHLTSECVEFSRQIAHLRTSEANCLYRVRELKQIMIANNISVPPSTFM